MNVSLPSNQTLPYFWKILMNILELQNLRDYFVDGLRKELCALECRKMHARGGNNIKIFSGIFHYQDGYVAYIT